MDQRLGTFYLVLIFIAFGWMFYRLAVLIIETYHSPTHEPTTMSIDSN